MKRVVFLVCCLICVIGINTHLAAYNPPTGGQSVLDLLSPTFLAGGHHITSLESPQADALNPAISGAKQRIALDLGYIALIGFGDEKGWKGHNANLGITIPTKVGVFTTSGHFVHSPFSGLDLGTLGNLRFSFAKDLYSDLLFGAGIGLTLGANDVFDWGLGLDLGILHLPGDLGIFKNFRWGVAIQNMGKWYAPVPQMTPYPAPFTPVLGVAFDLVDTEPFDFGLKADLGFPSFQNAYASLGGEFTLFDTVAIQVNGRVDAQELFNEAVASRSVIPSFGVSFTFTTDISKDVTFISERGWSKSEVKTQFAAAPLYEGIWGFGAGLNVPLGVIDSNPPEIEVSYDTPIYMSPNNDGTADVLEFPVSIEDERFVMGYTLSIYDEKGTLVQEIENKEKRPENEGFQNIIDRLTAVKRGIVIPEQLRWDGKTMSGATAEDGTYTFTISAWDDNNNTATTQEYSVHIDNTPPEIVLEEPKLEERIFSPNGDGNKDQFTFTQEGSAEDLWKGRIYDTTKRTVKELTWEDGPPVAFSWDGKNEEGVLVPDGIYGYEIESTDRAGNYTKTKLENIIINTQITPININISTSYFSPNGDGVKDSMEFIPSVPIQSGIISWDLVVQRKEGMEVRRYSGEDSLPDTIVYEGRNNSGDIVPEGEYQAILMVQYQNGNIPEESSPTFHVDLTPPRASVSLEYPVFSPNADGKKDLMIFFQESTPEDFWTGKVTDEKGNTVRNYTWIKQVDRRATWDGHNSGGKLLPDGRYSYRISAVDRAGNRGESEPVFFSLDTEETPLLLSVEHQFFSPNGDGIKDTVKLFPTLEETSGIRTYILSILNSQGNSIRTFQGRANVPEFITWDGFDNEGDKVEDGEYSAKMTVLYEKGNEPEAKTRPFTLDTLAPKVTVDTEYRLFSPEGDGNKDTLEINQDTSEEEVWKGVITDSEGKVVREYYWKGTVPDLSWNGTDEDGNSVPDGTYTYTLESEDRAGNRGKGSIDTITIDTTPTTIFVVVDKEAISPNNDGIEDSLEIQTIINNDEGLINWYLEITHELGEVIKTFQGTGIPEKVIWNGRDESENVVEGRYTAVLRAEYEKGNKPTSNSLPFVVDISPPKVGIDMRPVPFSPDNDGLEDELHIYLNVEDLIGVEEWSLNIKDPKGADFYSFHGKGIPSNELVWDGLSDNGELVMAAEDYPWTFKAVDKVGNEAEKRGEIPVDILVIRDGDRLKIRISSINFAPNSPELVQDDEDIKEKNQRVLTRLAEILNKYKSHSIRIEGHAVSVYWSDPERAKREEEEELKPLSLARAETVKEALGKLGVREDRIQVRGLGGTEPLVPHSDLDNRWKNRRVEFILVR